ncbi:MAG: phosphopantetheine-binding protein [Pseudonocardiaceae bacterium]
MIGDGAAASTRRRADDAFQWLELDDLLNAVTDLVRCHLPPESAAVLDDPDADLTSAGFESLALVALLVDLETQFAITFPADQLDVGTFRSVNTITAALQVLLGRRRGSTGVS